jgi:dihydroorotase
MRNLDHLLGGFLNPHLFCKPVLKRPEDQEALVAAAFGGEARFFLGTDSAPHQRGQKECDCGCAGTYTAPVAIPALYQFYRELPSIRGDDVEEFQAFTAERERIFIVCLETSLRYPLSAGPGASRPNITAWFPSSPAKPSNGASHEYHSRHRPA